MERQQEGRNANAVISDAAVRLLHEYTGRGPTRSRTTIDRDSVVILLGDTLTRGEHKLVEAGKKERVLEVRHDFQLVMQEDLVAAVETATERNVIAFMSQNHIDPDLAVEVFVLAPVNADADGSPAP